MNIEQARYNMVEQQVRPCEVLDSKVLDLMELAPREAFVPEAYRNLAYADIMTPLDAGEVMMPPRIEARMLQSLQIENSDRVLEIGTGYGYMTHLLAALAGHVVSMEIRPEFTERAQQNLKAQSTYNVTLECADGLLGRPVGAPYDVIAVTGSLPQPDDVLKRQLSIGGRMFIVVGEAPAMHANLITRTGEHQWRTECLFETVIPALIGAPQKHHFVL